MRSFTPSLQDLAVVADAVAQSADRRTAIDTLIAGISDVLDTRAALFVRRPRGWTLLAQTRSGVGVALDDLRLAFEACPPDRRTAVIDLSPIGEGPWTFMSLTPPAGPPMAALLAGDWTASQPLVSAAFLLSLALGSVQDRELRVRAHRRLIDGYALSRRLSHLDSVDAVCQRIVEHVARSLGVDRVAVAVHQSEDDRLAVAATHGYPIAAISDVRIERGAWVLGHVYASGRPVVVPDVRRVRAMSTGQRRYRTFSFAAVPLRAGRDTIGVLSATDKHDNSAFDRDDALTLRTLSASATLAILAARSETEVRRLAHAATVESLTGLFNRQYFDARLHEELERAKRGSSPLTVIMADVDDFKAINDRYGHQAGDAVLQAVGVAFRSAVRVFDVCARYGGDEFAILMPMSDHSSAAACAERIRQRLAERSAADEAPQVPRITVSIGVAVTAPGDKPEDLIGRADQGLYQAKANGKNRVRLHAAPSTLRPMPIGGRRPNAV